MKDLEEAYAKIGDAFKKRRTMVMAVSPKNAMEPGEVFKSESIELPNTPKKMRPRRIVINVLAHPPEMRFFTKGVGGSKRKGRRASNLYFASLMCHRPDSANLTLDDVRVDASHQMIGPIPASFFSPNAFQNDVEMDVGRRITVVITNRENHRRVTVSAAVFVEAAE